MVKKQQFSFAGLLTKAGKAASWEKANENRGSIASELGVKSASWSCRTKASKRDFIDATRMKNAVDALTKLPSEGEYIHIVTGQEFAGFDLIPAMLQLAKSSSYTRLILSTLGFSNFNLTSLAGMVERGAIRAQGLEILCSDFFRRADRSIWEQGSKQAERLGYVFKSTRNHTKLILAQFADVYIVVESSANLRSCANLEQFCVTRSKALFDFHLSWLKLAFASGHK